MTHEMPALTVEIEFETDVWTDVSADVLAGSTQRGLSRFGGVYATAEAGSLELALKNHLAAYDPTNEDSPYWSETNLLTNPGFEVDLTGVVERAGASINPVRDTAVFRSGVASVRQDLSSGVTDGLYFDVTATTTPGEEYRAVSWLRRSTYVGNDPHVSLWDNVAGFQFGNSISTVNEWQRSLVTATFDPTSTSRRIYIWKLDGTGNGTTGGAVWADDVNLRLPGGESLVQPMTRVRVLADAIPLWFGFIDSWQLDYPGLGFDAIARVRATDPIKYWSNVQRFDEVALAAGFTGARLEELAADPDLDWPPLALAIAPGTVEMGASQPEQVGAAFWALAKEAGDVEVGDLYFDGAGTLTFRDRESITTEARSTVVQAIFGDDGSELGYVHASLNIDDTRLANVVTVTSSLFPNAPETAEDAASIAKYLRRDFDVTLNILTLDETAEHAAWALFLLANPSVRFEDLTINPLADAASLFPEALGREIGDRIAVKMRPLGRATPIEREVFIRGISHEWTPSTWRTRWALADAGPWTFTFLTFDDATLGQFGFNSFGWGD